MEDFIFIKRLSSIIEANLLKNLLESSHNIKTTIMNSGVEFPGDLGDSYGADLMVWSTDYERAKDVLDEYYKESK